MKKKRFQGKFWGFCLDGLAMIAGSVLYALSVNCFTAPNHIAPGGVTGLATALNAITDWPIGLTSLAINVPLFILSIIFVGGAFTVKTIIATVMVNVAIDTMTFLPTYQGDTLLCCLFAGVMSGVAIGLFFLRGSTSGGTDIVARLVRIRWKNLSTGRLIMLCDLVVITFAGVIFRSLESALYAVVVIYVQGVAIDRVITGGEGGKCFLVITDKKEEVADAIFQKLDRGVTLLDGQGYYTRKEKKVLLCTVRRNEAAAIHNIVRRTDPDAFAIALPASDVLGQGFRSWHDNS